MAYSYNGHSKKILLTGSSSGESRELRDFLIGKGYGVILESGPSRVYDYLKQDSCDLVISHGHQDELNFCREIRRFEEGSYIPIIVLGRYSDPYQKIELLYNGADECLELPVHFYELTARMESLMRRLKMKNHASSREHILAELKNIIYGQKIQPHFQPIYELKPFKLLGLEVLSRPITDSELSNPELLFRAALEYQLYHQLEMVAWNKALEVLGTKVKHENLFFNCNPTLIESVDVSSLSRMFEKVDFPTEHVVLEITERSQIAEYKFFYHRLRNYRHSGFRIAVDDVGGGFASLESIVETRPEVVKIDRHIIQGIDKDLVKQSIIKFVVAFCRDNKILSIAEGVETKEEFEAVKALGVDAVQGFYLAKPTPYLDLKEMANINM